jgi:dienelactone hydrolase
MPELGTIWPEAVAAIISCILEVNMLPVNIMRARQLARASALAYEDQRVDIVGSKLWTDAGLIDNDQLQVLQDPTGRDTVLVAQATFGVVVAFRGTLAPAETGAKKAMAVALDWINDFGVMQSDVTYAAGQVHMGFKASLENLWAPLLRAVTEATADGRRLFITGHSKGGALATLAAIRFKTAGYPPAGVMTFGAPKVADDKFSRAYNVEMPNHWRFEHQDDIVPHLPPQPLTLAALKALKSLAGILPYLKQLSGEQSYDHVGNLCFLDWDDRLREANVPPPEWERQLRILVAGSELIFDHFLLKSKFAGGYLETVDMQT